MSLNRIQMFKRKVMSKYNFILQELERTNGILEKAKLEIDEKVGAFLKEDDEALSSQFNQIDEDLELFHNKLCFIQEELENGKLSIESDATYSLTGKKHGISAVTQNGTSVGLHIGGDIKQLEAVSSSSSQNEKIPFDRNTFHEQVIPQCHSESEKKSNIMLSACGAELNVPSSFCNESMFPNNTGSSSDICSSQSNAITVNTHHGTKEINIERSKIVKSNFMVEQVSSSDGSSVYGTVSSLCSEVHTVDRSETSATNDAMKLIHDSVSLSKQNIHHSHLHGPVKQNSDQDILGTLSAGDTLSESVPYPDLEIGNIFSATVADITSPSDFWIQIDSEYMKQLCPIEGLVVFYDGLHDIKKNVYCLAPFKEQKGYFRAKILELTETIPGKQRAKVLYIDLGCRGSLNTSVLKVLPPSLQKIPCIAVHCALHGVVPVNGVWSHQAITEFKKTIEVSHFKISICSRVRDTYFVKISIITCIPGNQKYIYDMSEFLSAFGYGVMENNAVSVQHCVSVSPMSCASVTSHDSSSRTTPKLSYQSSLSNELPVKNNEETSLPSKNEFPLNNNSHDQDMLTDGFDHDVHQSRKPDLKSFYGNKEEKKQHFTDNKKHDRKFAAGDVVTAHSIQMNVTNISNFQNGTEKNLSTNSVSESVSCVNNKGSYKSVIGKFVGESTQVHVINISKNENGAEKNSLENIKSSSVNRKFEPHGSKSTLSCSIVSATDSCNLDQNLKVPTNNLPCVTGDSSNTNNMTSQSSCNDFDWNVKIPLPSQKFVKKAKFIVMLSAIVSPSDFYVNLAMPTSNELDELQEHMLCVYQNFDTSSVVLPPLNKLSGMFCCCQFPDDKNWYRVQVLELCSPMGNAQNSSTQALIQYVDYGNEAEVNISELLPLKKEFANHPPFSFHCALAGIKPKLAENFSLASSMWDEEAITRFRCLASFDKCYTAEIADTVMYDARKTPMPVYLWDNISAKDILINIILVEQGAADGSDLELLNCPAEGNVQDMDLWDPMAADFNSTLNSYGVNLNDPEMATVGYKANDEAYVCKFFAATGKCQRGDKCYYQHIFPSGDSTLDQEPVEYLGKTVTLPQVESAVFVMVSAMFNPSHFFVVFPFGTKSLESIYSEIRRYAYEERDLITEFMDNMNKYYNRNHCRKENTAIAVAIGDLVAVKWKDSLWYRGRVCDVFDVAAPLVVYFVDFGNCEHIERVDVYELEPQFRHFPFQAIECHLHAVEAKLSEGSQWSSESKSKFQELTEGKTLVAHIKSICGSSLYVELFSYVKNQEFSINEYLVQNGYGQFVRQGGCNNSLFQSNDQKEKWDKTVVFIPA